MFIISSITIRNKEIIGYTRKRMTMRNNPYLITGDKNQIKIASKSFNWKELITLRKKKYIYPHYQRKNKATRKI